MTVHLMILSFDSGQTADYHYSLQVNFLIVVAWSHKSMRLWPLVTFSGSDCLFMILTLDVRRDIVPRRLSPEWKEFHLPSKPSQRSDDEKAILSELRRVINRASHALGTKDLEVRETLSQSVEPGCRQVLQLISKRLQSTEATLLKVLTSRKHF